MLVILLILNILIARKMQETLNKKKRMTSIGQSAPSMTPTSIPDVAESTSAKLTTSKKSKESKNRTTKMVLTDCLNSFVGRFPLLVYFILSNALDAQVFGRIKPVFSTLTFICVYAAYGAKFFIYLNFNKKFRTIFFDHVSLFRKFVYHK